MTDYIKMALEAGFYSDEIEFLERFAKAVRADAIDEVLNTRRWTKEMLDAWHKNIPDLQAAFNALKKEIK